MSKYVHRNGRRVSVNGWPAVVLGLYLLVSAVASFVQVVEFLAGLL